MALKGSTRPHESEPPSAALEHQSTDMWQSTLPSSQRISVLRHGESENNVLGIDCAAASNSHLYGLTPRGIEQIEHVAAEEHTFDLILHSPLRRAIESAQILSQRWGIPLECEELLIEVNIGVFENRPEAERIAWKLENGSRFYPSGESQGDIEKRLAVLLNRLYKDYMDKNVLLEIVLDLGPEAARR